MKLNWKTSILLAGALLALLAIAFWWGGDAPGLVGYPAPPPAATAVAVPPAERAAGETPAPGPAQAVSAGAHSPIPSGGAGGAAGVAPSAPAPPPPASPLPTGALGAAGETRPPAGNTQQAEPGKAEPGKAPVTAKTPAPPLPTDRGGAEPGDTPLTCTLSVRCDVVLAHLDWLPEEKRELVPEDGVIFPATTVTFYAGETVFQVLQRELKREKIHMEFVETPLYHAAYLEGIHNLYEFDCGELSGWLYQVNGWFPDYGSSRYPLQQGDAVEWVYTCDGGQDVGRDGQVTP